MSQKLQRFEKSCSLFKGVRILSSGTVHTYTQATISNTGLAWYAGENRGKVTGEMRFLFDIPRLSSIFMWFLLCPVLWFLLFNFKLVWILCTFYWNFWNIASNCNLEICIGFNGLNTSYFKVIFSAYFRLTYFLSLWVS